MKRIISIIGLLVVLTIGASIVFAGTLTISGSLDAGDPKMNVVSIITPNCGLQFPTPVAYDTYPFTVDVGGTYTINMTSTGTLPGFASFYLYQSSFDPANGEVNCIAGNNDADPKIINIPLTAGTQYILVPFDDSIAQVTGTYTASINGPGNISLVNPASACTYPLPAGSVIYNVPAGAPAFFQADLGSQTNFNLPAGTWYISEFTGDFAKVWMACQAQPFFIPANAVAR